MNIWNFNVSLTNDVFNIEQLGPVCGILTRHNLL